MVQPLPGTVTPRDPLRTFRFRVYLEPGAQFDYIAGVRTVSGLTWSISAQETWSGGNNYHRYANPDRITWEPLTLEQGLALDDTLEQWANAARDFHKGGKTGVKRTLFIDLWNDADTEIVRTYRIRNAWVSKLVALPKLDAMSSEIALLSVEVIHEGWVVEEF